MIKIRYIHLLLLLLLLSACTPSSRLREAGQAAVRAQKWIYYDTADFELQVPANWRMDYVDQSPLGTDSSQLVIYGATPQGAIDTSVVVYLFKESIPLIQSLGKYTELTAFNIEGTASVESDVTTRFMELPIGSVSRLRFRNRSFNDFGGTVVSDVEQYLLIRNGIAYGLSFSAPAPRMGYYRPIFETIAQTWFFHDQFTIDGF